jgi:AcrR family transcriptional regulator
MTDRIETLILNKAADHLRVSGAEFLRVTAIARDLNMSHANIYRHFPSKDALIEAVIATWLRGIEKLLRDIADSPDPADDKLERFIRELATRVREKIDQDPAFFTVYRKAWLAGNAGVSEHRAALRRLIERILDEGTDPGPFHIKSQERGIDLVVDSFHRFIHPEALFEMRDLPKARFDQRLLAVSKTVIRALSSNYV